jgi:RimJ/RimL family protein N-acetyltransferase
MPSSFHLREVIPDDLAVFFEQQTDPESNHMAAFTTKDPTDRDAFMARWQRMLANSAIVVRTIVSNARVVGYVVSFEEEGRMELGCWLEKEYWGQGIATRALAEFLASTQTIRPVYARAAKDNSRSLRMLEKCGFVRISDGRGFANARGEEIDEWLLELTGPAPVYVPAEVIAMSQGSHHAPH